MKRPESKRFLALVALGLGCMPGFGQDSPAYRACNDTANTQTEMNRCASEEARRTDAELNAIYTTLLVELSKNPLAVAKVKLERSAWINYRDAYVNAMYPEENKQAAYGTMFPMEVDLLYASLTRGHIKAMIELQHSFESNR